MTPGAYVRSCREAEPDMTREDLALRLDSEPPVSHRARAELLEEIEADLVPISLSAALALARALPTIDIEHLADLVDQWRAESFTAVRLTSPLAPGAAA